MRFGTKIKSKNVKYMSQIENNENVLCDVCGCIVPNFTFCKTKSLEARANVHFIQRCHKVVCYSCEYCSSCDPLITFLKKAIRSEYLNIEFSDNRNRLKKDIERLEKDFGIVYNGRK